MPQYQILKKWLVTICILFSLLFIPTALNKTHYTCWLFFNSTTFFISFIFWSIIFLAEKQNDLKKLGFSIAAIVIKFMLTIIAMVAYFSIYKQKSKVEILTAFGITGIYFVISYMYLYKLTKIK